jgi:SAM-dependent methyltransferase
MSGHFHKENGIWVTQHRPRHRDAEYDAENFEFVIEMQRKHFWYQGQHKLLLSVLKHEIDRNFKKAEDVRGIDMGGGGWLDYLNREAPGLLKHLALGDSSMRALALAEPVVGPLVTRYEMDLKDLGWNAEWDVVFLLDVLEHIPEHEHVLRQIHKSLRLGGLLFITTPALKVFWSYNDELAKHQRRYCPQDFMNLASATGFSLLRTDFFMFFLSPLLLMSRCFSRPLDSDTRRQRREHMAHTHRTPPPPINKLLTAIFYLEASLVNRIGFHWGTSILAVMRREQWA